MADRDEDVHLGGGPAVPAAQIREQRLDEGRLDGRAPEILLEERPGVAHRREADAEVPAAGGLAEALGDAMARRDQQFGVRSRQRARGQRHERQELSVVAVDPGQAVEERSPDRMRADELGDDVRVAHERGDGGGGEGLAEAFEHALAAAHAGQPVVPEGHRRAAGRRREDLRPRRGVTARGHLAWAPWLGRAGGARQAARRGSRGCRP